MGITSHVIAAVFQSKQAAVEDYKEGPADCTGSAAYLIARV